MQTVPPEELLGELKALRVTAGPAVTGLSALREWTIEYCRGGSHPDDLLHVMRKVGFGPMEDPDADEDEVKSLTPASSPWRTTSPESG
ncbi:hypothetical protein [Streptomyces sp. MH13]|uniref:hypothetical protein n=1 Tax=unclassified Streptomyces TaxID=2593676 RepID=UPI003CF33FCC